jgi:hypothetical protein
MIGFSYTVWWSQTNIEKDYQQIADTSEQPASGSPLLDNDSSSHEIETADESILEDHDIPKAVPSESPAIKPNTVRDTPQTQEKNVALNRIKENKNEERQITESMPPIAEQSTREWEEVPEIKVPPISLEDPVVEHRPESTVEYTVKIVSRGYSTSPEKENLVDGIESKIGGFFTKVDQGFADLQDAKDNLFASLTTKKERNKE